jgi:hypothetical protein
MELYLHSPHAFTAWCLAKHRDNFSFMLRNIINWFNFLHTMCVMPPWLGCLELGVGISWTTGVMVMPSRLGPNELGCDNIVCHVKSYIVHSTFIYRYTNARRVKMTGCVIHICSYFYITHHLHKPKIVSLKLSAREANKKCLCECEYVHRARNFWQSCF